MNTIHRRKSSVIAGVAAAVAATAAPAFLFAGAGTAKAGTWVNTNTDALGVTAHVHSFGEQWLVICGSRASSQPRHGMSISTALRPARTARPNTSSTDHRERRWRGRRDQMLRLSRHSTLHHDSFRYIVDLSETQGRFPSKEGLSP